MEYEKELMGEINDLLIDFGKKREKYAKITNRLKTAEAISGVLISFVLGLSFIDGFEIQFKIIGMLLGALTAAIVHILNIYNYEGKWRQRSVTYLKLLSLKRKLKLEQSKDPTVLKNYEEELNRIMEEDSQQWFDDFDQTRKKTQKEDTATTETGE